MTNRLRVLHIVETPAGGVGRSLVDVVVGQIARGFDVTILYSVKRADKNFLDFIESQPEARLIQIPMRRSLHFSDLIVTWKVRRMLREEEPFDVIHGHSSKGGAIARLAGLGNKIACFYTPHAIYTLNPLLSAPVFQFFRAIEVGLSFVTNRVITDSLEEEAHCLALGMPRSRVAYIPNAVGPAPVIDKSEARKALGLPEKGTIIGWIGKIDVQKDPKLIIRSFAIVADKYRDVSLAFAGLGPMLPELQQLANECGIADRVFFLGFRPGLQVMAACDIYSMTSFYEGLAYVLLEALSMGLPIVITDMIVAHSIVDDGINGSIVKKRDPVNFAEALIRLVEDPEFRRQCAEASLEKSKEFELSKMIDDTMQVYADALPPSRRIAMEPTANLAALP